MTCRLSKLAAASYDVLLDGVTIASLVRTDVRHQVKWSTELLVEPPPEQMPPPFTAPEHDFAFQPRAI